LLVVGAAVVALAAIVLEYLGAAVRAVYQSKYFLGLLLVTR
jgi:hypothetical protein